MTKQELLQKHKVYMCDNLGVHAAMEEYAQQEGVAAIEFAMNNERILTDGTIATTIYEKYLESKNKKQ